MDRMNYEKIQRNQTLREKFRLIVLGLIVTIFMYPFISQSVHYWSSTQIGDGNGEGGKTIISWDEYRNLTATCFGDANPLSSAEERVISAFVMIGSIAIILFTTWRLIRILTGTRSLWKFPLWTRLMGIIGGLKLQSGKGMLHLWRLIQIVLLFGPISLAIPLLWGILRLRQLQSNLAIATRSAYADDEWTFGQVVSIVIFAPVLFEMLYCWFEY